MMVLENMTKEVNSFEMYFLVLMQLVFFFFYKEFLECLQQHSSCDELAPEM